MEINALAMKQKQAKAAEISNQQLKQLKNKNEQSNIV